MDWIVEPLRIEQARVVYPLLQSVDPRLGLRSFMQYMRCLQKRSVHRTAGILVARHHKRLHPSGVLCWRKSFSPKLGWILLIDYCAALDLLCAETILDALLARLDQLAASLRCATIIGVAQNNSDPLRTAFSTRGHQQAGILLMKQADASAVPGAMDA